MNLHTFLRAEVAVHAGREDDALKLLEQEHTFGESSAPAYPRASERMLRAHLLSNAGRYREAIQWYESVPEDLGFGLMFIGPRHLGMARSYAALHDTTAAKREYAIVERLWAHADPQFRVMLESDRRIH